MNDFLKLTRWETKEVYKAIWVQYRILVSDPTALPWVKARLKMLLNKMERAGYKI